MSLPGWAVVPALCPGTGFSVMLSPGSLLQTACCAIYGQKELQEFLPGLWSSLRREVSTAGLHHGWASAEQESSTRPGEPHISQQPTPVTLDCPS